MAKSKYPYTIRTQADALKAKEMGQSDLSTVQPQFKQYL